jgi:hypothetical protein
MAKLLMDSTGWEIGSWRFPAFQLREGQAITLSLPSGARADRVEEPVLCCLTGKQKAAGLEVFASVVSVVKANPKSGWSSWFKSYTPSAWLKDNTPLTDVEISSLLSKHRIDNRFPLASYALTPRFLLGLMKTYTLEAEAVVFDTAGLDPMGCQTVFRIVEEHLPKVSAIYLAWPFYCNGVLNRYQMPGSLCLSVADLGMDITENAHNEAPSISR